MTISPKVMLVLFVFCTKPFHSVSNNSERQIFVVDFNVSALFLSLQQNRQFSNEEFIVYSSFFFRNH